MCNSNMEDEHSNTIPILLYAIEKHSNGKHISFKDYNIHYPI